MAANIQGKGYEIIVFSGWRWIAVVLPTGPGVTFLLLTLLPNSVPTWTVIVAVLLPWLLVDRFVSPLVRGKVFITLSKEGVSCIWTKRYFWSKLPDILLTWDRVVEYVFESYSRRDTFRFRLTHNEEFRFHRYTLFLSPRDDFERFKHELPKFLDALDLEGGRKVRMGRSELRRIFSFNSRKQ